MLIPWTIEIKQLATQLRVGADPQQPQAVSVDITIRALTPAFPQVIEDCMNYQPICAWVLRDWQARPHTPLMTTRVRELMTFIFDFDERIEAVDVSVAAGGVVVHRWESRPDFEQCAVELPRVPMPELYALR